MKLFVSEGPTVGLNFQNTTPSRNPTNIVIPSTTKFMGIEKAKKIL